MPIGLVIILFFPNIDNCVSFFSNPRRSLLIQWLFSKNQLSVSLCIEGEVGGRQQIYPVWSSLSFLDLLPCSFSSNYMYSPFIIVPQFLNFLICLPLLLLLFHLTSRWILVWKVAIDLLLIFPQIPWIYWWHSWMHSWLLPPCPHHFLLILSSFLCLCWEQPLGLICCTFPPLEPLICWS